MNKYNVIKIDNFDRDYIPNEVIAGNIPKDMAEQLAIKLNVQYSGQRSSYFYKIVEFKGGNKQ
uniref:Uncharacterized protein n=1 Tax=viral metagenome TaxID=1070528 RepID=A0A6M3K126_9ZZZZ